MNQGSLASTLGLITVVAAASIPQASLAADRALMVPNRTIYPKEAIKEDDFLVRLFQYEPRGPSLYIESIQPFSGFNARTTLPAFKPVPIAALERARQITVGTSLRIIYVHDGIEIVATGIALQPGSVGEKIQVRNSSGGTIVAGTIQPDGNVRMSSP